MVKTREPKKRAAREPELEGAVISGLLEHWVHQDQLFWSRINLLLIIQGSVVAGWFTLSNRIISGVIVAIGAFFSLALLFIAALDERDRDNIKSLIQTLLEQTNINPKFIEEFRNKVPQDKLPGGTFVAKFKKRLFTGGWLLWTSILLIALFDLALFTISMFYPDLHDLIKFR